MLFYTDGITEAVDSNESLVGEMRLMKLLQQNGQESVKNLVEIISEDVHLHTGNAQFIDDLTIVLLRMR